MRLALADIARVQATCHHEFEGTDTCQWCGLTTAFTPEQEAVIERVAAAVVTASRADRQPHPDVTGTSAPFAVRRRGPAMTTSSGPGAPPREKPMWLFSRRLLTVPLGGGRHVRVEYVFSPCDHGKHPKRCGRCRLRIAAARVQS